MITEPSAERDWLMLMPSFICTPQKEREREEEREKVEVRAWTWQVMW